MAEEIYGLNIHLIFVGRLNPPTVNGHLKVIKKMINKANLLIEEEERDTGNSINNYKITIYLTMTQNNKTDPLKPDKKKKYLDKLIERLNENNENPKKIKINVEINPNCNNPLKALQCAYKFNNDKLSDKIFYFLGKDREDLFYVSRKYFYDRYPETTIQILPEIQDRDLDEGVSASKIRSYIVENDDTLLYNEYQNYLNNEEIQELKNLVRQGLNLPTSVFTPPIDSSRPFFSDVPTSDIEEKLVKVSEAVPVSVPEAVPEPSKVTVPLRRSARLASKSGGLRKIQISRKNKNKSKKHKNKSKKHKNKSKKHKNSKQH